MMNVVMQIEFKLCVAAATGDQKMWEQAQRQLYVLLTAKEVK